METLNTDQRRSGTIREWNEAHRRLEDYLRAYRLADKWHEHRLMGEILRRAAERHGLDPGASPAKAAIETAQEMIDEWFSRILPEVDPARRCAQGRACLLLVDAGDRWPAAFLSQEPPADFLVRMKEVSIRLTPEMDVTPMNPCPMDYGSFPRLTGAAFQEFKWAPVLHGFVLWLLLFLAAFTYYERFQ